MDAQPILRMTTLQLSFVSLNSNLQIPPSSSQVPSKTEKSILSKSMGFDYKNRKKSKKFNKKNREPATPNDILFFRFLRIFSFDPQTKKMAFSLQTYITMPEETAGKPYACPFRTAYDRYSNIFPYKESAVPLSLHPWYFNGSRINTPSGQFLATQGPLPHTVEHFFQALWDSDSHIIVMVTNTVENGLVKSEQYWPNDETKDFEVKSLPKNDEDSGQIVFRVKLLKTFQDGPIVFRSLRLINERLNPCQAKDLVHIQHPEWKDQSPPDMACLNYLIDFTNFLRKPEHPLVTVHCSAGVGRTGVFILCHLLKHLISINDLTFLGKKNPCYVRGDTIIDTGIRFLRDQRKLCVSSVDQYGFCVQYFKTMWELHTPQLRKQLEVEPREENNMDSRQMLTSSLG